MRIRNQVFAACVGLVALASSGCVGALQGGTVTVAPIAVPRANPSGCLAFWITDAATHGPVKAHIVLGRDRAIPLDTNADGYVYTIQATAKYQVTVTADGYVSVQTSYDVTAWDCDTPIGLTAAHVDPVSIPRAKLLAFRGSLFTVTGDCQLPMFLDNGQRVPVLPFAPLWATAAQRQCTYDAWKKRGYTHGVEGPGIDPGYHNQTPSVDMRADGGAAWMDQLEEAFDQGFVPIVVAVPDHYGPDKSWQEHIWAIDELRELEPIYRSPRFQRLARVVMLCWECQGDKYGWPNTKYIEYGAWLKSVFPNAVRVLHTIADIEVPVGAGDELDTAHCHGLGPDRCLTGGQAWTRVAPFFDVWFEQSSALFEPDHVADNGAPDGQNWLHLLWDQSNPGSLVRRFRDGSNGYPTSILPVPAEYKSYLVWWRGETEDEARRWGDRAVAVGACCYMDGGSVPVPLP